MSLPKTTVDFASRATQGDRLSRAVSDLVAYSRIVRELHDDVDAYHAPSECHTLVAQSDYVVNEPQRIAQRHGYNSPSELIEAASSRVPYRYFYWRCPLAYY